MSFLSQLHWRYATKKFDTHRKVSDQDLEKIIEAIRLTPTSFGLQPYHFYIVNDPNIKQQIQQASWNQEQVSTCSHLIIFVARGDLVRNKDEYFEDMSWWDADFRAKLWGFEMHVTNTIQHKQDQWVAIDWAIRQTYIAHGFALAACAELQIDSCPMEGADFTKISTILSLPEEHTPVLMLPIGYRADGEAPRGKKVRFSKQKLFTIIE